MLGFASKKLLKPKCIARLIPTLFFSSKAALGSQIVIRSWKDPNFTISYLVESCGLSPEAAKCIHFGFSDIPDASRLAERSKDVILILKHFGFHDYLIAKLVLKKPQLLLLSDFGNELNVQLELLVSLGAQPSTATEILLNFPAGHLLDKFVPFVDFLRNLRLSDEEVVEMVRNFCVGDGFDPEAFLGNMEILREVGMTDSIVSHFIRADDQKSMLFMPRDLFKKIVDEVKVMGLSPKRCVFVDAMLGVSAIGVEVYKQKSIVFKKLGCSDVDLLKAFVEKPQLLEHTENKINEVMDCFVGILGFKSSVVVLCPLVFTCSKKKLISRFCVAKFLWERGVINVNSYKMSSFLETDERIFLKRFVTKHKEIVPELFDLYSQCKTDGKPFHASKSAPCLLYE